MVLKSANFGICNVVGLNGFKYAFGLLDVYISASTNVPFRPKMMKMPNFAQIETKRITVHCYPFRVT